MDKNSKIRVDIFLVIILVIIGVFILRLAQLQLWNDKYITSSYNLSIKKKMTLPERGFIYDRNGKLLVANKPLYDIKLTYSRGLGKKFDTLGLCKLLHISKAKLNKVLKKARFKYNTPFVIRENVVQNEIARIQEKIYRFPNITITNQTSREYLIHSGYHILGYLRKISSHQLEEDSIGYYNENDRVGKAGVEASYEKILRGRKGISYFRTDIRGNIIGSYNRRKRDIKPVAGKDIQLTIDFDLQQYAEKVMQNKRGAIVAIDPNTGEILTMVSSPYIDPNNMNGQNFNHYYPIYNNDSIYNRLNNKAAAGLYPPGSTFKPLIALIGLQEGIIQESVPKYICRHGFSLGHGRKISCHCGYYNRPMTLDIALARSCNTFFAATYRDIIKKYHNDSIGINKWREYLRSFGLDSWFGNDVHEGSRGKIPSANTYNRYYGSYAKRKWNVMASVSNGIGQGEVELTPLQMANFTAAIANEGFYYTPHIVKAIGNKVMTDSIYRKKNTTLINPKYFKSVIKGMKRVFLDGTAASIRYPPIPMAGKTGTSQNSQGEDHSVFILFAPVEHPKIAIATIVENAHWGSSWAAPISSLIAEKYLTGTVKRIKLEKRMTEKSFFHLYKKQAVDYYKKVQENKRKSRMDALIKNIQNAFKAVEEIKIRG